jgi:uncharacterized membrane protein YtjA (UPF0391 family)
VDARRHERLGTPRASAIRQEETTMLGWALTFLVLALIAGLLGFGGIAGVSANIAWIFFVVFLVLTVVAAVARALGGKSPV